MNPLYTLYASLSSVAFLFLYPPFWVFTRLSGRHREGLKERLGFFPPSLAGHRKGSSRVWIHAASLGEIKVAGALVEHLKSLKPGCEIVLSATTDHGRALAAGTLEGVQVVYAPIDLLQVPFVPGFVMAPRT